jgi:glycosyltransferase involved in cell wall biosynthesis
MTITIPLFALRGGRTSGVEYAIFNLMQGLHASGSDLRVAHSNPKYLAPHIRQWLHQSRIPTRRYPALGGRMASRFVEESLYGLAERADRVIFPNYFLPFATPRIDQRAVFLMDVQHRVFPQFFSRRKVAWLDLTIRHTLAKADRILFISQFELDQTRRFYGDDFKDRARVVHVALDWKRFNEAPVRSDLLPSGDRPFILSVSQQYPHKRLDVLIRAFQMMAKRQPEPALVLTGRPAPDILDRLRAELDEELAHRVHFTGFVSDTELGYLYRRASLFALPSVYEGFGMPAVEAISFGKPALLADATAVPEVTRGLARYLPPEAGPEEWARELEDMIVSPPVVEAEQIRALRTAYDPITIANRVRSALD